MDKTSKKRLAVLGSTGSVGQNTLKVVSEFPERFCITALAAGKNVSCMADQIRQFSPEIVALSTEADAEALIQKKFSSSHHSPRVVWGMEGIREILGRGDIDLVVSAISGSAGFLPTLEALKRGLNVALANKEAIVMGGRLLVQTAQSSGAKIIPIDSEHSAIFQLIQGLNSPKEIRRIILTASGGPFLKTQKERLSNVSPLEACSHPTWKMGEKISVDSATLMNKALEVIEAHWLFGLPADQIEVYIHPESVIHALVECRDGAMFAHLGIPNMQLPIAFALSYPERMPVSLIAPLDLPSLSGIHFARVDHNQFPSLSLAYRALACGGTMPAVLNAANEVAVEAFMTGQLRFPEITDIVSRVMQLHNAKDPKDVLDIFNADGIARIQARRMIDE